jgi:tetratricopeptide (TPR) repeat protein
MDLFQRADERNGEATAAFNLGHAYKDIPALRDLDQAEHWYRRYLELLDEHDTLGRALGIGQLGNLAYERLNDARAAGAPDEQLLRHLNDAADAYHKKLGLLPDNAVGELAVTHHGLGTIYGDAGDIATALGHFQRAISYRERQDDRYGAGWARLNAALTLAQAGRRQDALLYARAALRDYDAVGPGAASRADQARQLVTELEQEPAHEEDAQAGNPT